MRIAIAAAAVLLIAGAGAAHAQDTTGASKSHMSNPQTVPESTGNAGKSTTERVSKKNKSQDSAIPATGNAVFKGGGAPTNNEPQSHYNK